MFLGTGARWPTPERLVAATLIARGSEHVLIDCGGGTQVQLMRSTAGLGRLAAIALTHLHGDHILGLPGLLATLGDGRRARLRLLGPPGTAALVDGLLPLVGDLGFRLEVREMEAGDEERLAGFRLIAAAGRHRVPSLAWCLQEEELPGHLVAARLRRLGVPPGPARARLAEGGDVVLPGGGRVSAADVTGPPRPGRRIVLSGDTAPTAGAAAIAAGADLLVHEATFLHRDRELADRSGHSTAADAARLAAAAEVGLLALTHRSTRYRREEVLAEARAVFPATVAPADLDLVRVPLRERGRPRLIPGGGAAGPAEVRQRRSGPSRIRGGPGEREARAIGRREDVMARIDGPGLATQAEELAGLVAGREPEETVARLHAVARCLARGELPSHADLSLFERVRARYGRELAEITRPEPW